ncbi:Gfo/Idh/MocA family protein [Megamonas hypermegale]|uniref:Gfo/Idh/MocA family protein n=1 Tax=Megamonas hypermegale TaxID=158847 RepID=UPI0026F03D9C|nr:Gfo/Idh/MocA family oxidoreductase [Megamonas hypermegale]
MIKYALIGTGRIAVNHVKAVKQYKDRLIFSAVCDLDEKNVKTCFSKAEYTEHIPFYSDYKQLINEIKPDFVAIATDSGKHAEIGKYCLEHGCHVLIEKPIAMNMHDARELIDIAKKNNLILGGCHQNRFNKSVQKLHEALVENRFGKISHIAAHVRWNRNEDYYKQAPWRGKWASDGGCLMNQCIHNADLVCWLLGDIDEVFAYTNNAIHPYIEGEDLGLALIKGKNGAYALFEGTVNVYPRNLEETLYVFGEKGTVKLAGKSVNLIAEWNFADNKDSIDQIKKESSEQPVNIYGFGHFRLYDDFIQAIETNGTHHLLVDGEAATKALELILAIYKSKKTGLPVKLPLINFASTDMKGTFNNDK